MGEPMEDKEKSRRLKEIVSGLNEGSDIRAVKKKFDRLLREVSPEEIANLEQELINEGMPVEHVQKLCDIHVEVFNEALKVQKKTKTLPGHPIHSYMMENRELKKRLKAFKKAAKSAKPGFLSALGDLMLIDRHYTRKENQLFPFLESVGFTGPSKVMWGKHDEIRALLKETEAAYSRGDTPTAGKRAKETVRAMKMMVFMEEKILFPTALRKLPDSVWPQIRSGEAAIGYSWITPGNLWDANLAAAGAPTPAPAAASEPDGKIPLDTGALSPAQINLLLKNLPFDMTYVDETGRVAYYSEGKERIFPRSPGIIGRDVANCHPPKSVHIVEKIVEALKSGEKEQAEFWLKMNGLFIHIRYFPIFDGAGVYRGIVEVSQEVSGIRALEGERRLLDW